MTGTELHNIAAASQNTENSADAVFQEEQNHLTSTYEAIEKIERNVLESMRKTAQEAEEDKRNMADELASNFASDGEKQETYIEYAQRHRFVQSHSTRQCGKAYCGTYLEAPTLFRQSGAPIQTRRCPQRALHRQCGSFRRQLSTTNRRLALASSRGVLQPSRR